jgi:hypothetical protein
MDPERHAAELAAAQAAEQAAAMAAAAQAAQVAEHAAAAHAAAQHAAAQAAQAAAYPAAPVPLAPPAQSDASVLRELAGAMQTLVVTMNTVIPAMAANSARAPANRLKVPSPGEYDGKPKKECGPWLSRVLNWLTCNDADPNTPDAVRAASALLSGAAQQWFQSCIQEARNAGYEDETAGGFANFREFAYAMERFLGDPLPELKARLDLQALVQSRSVMDYASNFQRLISYIPAIDAGTLKFTFWAGLKPKIKELLTGKTDDFKSWHDIRDLAHRFDTQLFIPKSSYSFTSPASRDKRDDPMDLGISQVTRGRPPTPGPSRGRSPAPRRSQSPSRSPGPRLSKLTPEERDQLRAAGACFRCRQTGHFSSNCPKARNPSAGPRRHSKN